MTDAEIDAALLPMIAKHIKVAQADCRILPFDRIAFRAGMRRAARVARNTAGEFFAASNVERSIGADIAAAAIERAAGGEG